MSTAPPRTLDDLNFTDPIAPPSTTLYKSLKSLRLSTLSIHNRLHSILTDSLFVQHVALQFSPYPLLANERCGSWYVPPALKAGSTYFKSTDGHHGQWAFSLRRLNLQLLDVLGENGGAVVVDSTRRGKRVPDAFARTVPVWVAVLNRALFKDDGGEEERRFRTYPGLGQAEVRQIEGRIDGFVRDFEGLGLDMQALRASLRHKPIRVRWVCQGQLGEVEEVEEVRYEDDGTDADIEDFNCLVLCSASRIVQGSEMSEGGYIQGSGDDHEGWSEGLTPALFWENKDLIMATPEEEVRELVTRLQKERVAVSGESAQKASQAATLVMPTKNLYVAAFDGSYTSGAIDFDVIINCQSLHTAEETLVKPHVLNLHLPPGKNGSRQLRSYLRQIVSFVKPIFGSRTTICSGGLAPQSAVEPRILIACSTGHDLSVGVALALLCLYFDPAGAIRRTLEPPEIDKLLVRQRMVWITACMPGANTSRETLKAVNSFLIDRPQ